MTKKEPNTNQLDLWLAQWSEGDDSVEEQLIQSLYPEIHKIAHFQIKSNDAKALQTTEIVSEAFIRLNDQKNVQWQNKNHFLAIAAKVIRRVVVDHYRAQLSQKRGGEQWHMTIDRLESMIAEKNGSGMNWLEMDDLLAELFKIDPEAAQVVEMKVFGGMTIPEMADMLSVSESSVSRNWSFARSWLLMQLEAK